MRVGVFSVICFTSGLYLDALDDTTDCFSEDALSNNIALRLEVRPFRRKKSSTVLPYSKPFRLYRCDICTCSYL